MCLSRSGAAQHQRLEPRVQHERRDRVDELHLEQLDGADLGERRRQLLRSRRSTCCRSCVELAAGKELRLRRVEVLGQQRDLRQSSRHA